MSLGDFADLVPDALRLRTGSVFYSGRSAFETRSDVYILGLNPAGDPSTRATETVQANIDEAIARPPGANWSAYVDEKWSGKPAGTYKMQPRIQHLLKGIDRRPSATPASNVVFVRSPREVGLGREKNSLLAACWPFHEAVISTLGIKVVICLGGTAGHWVRKMSGADTLVDQFVEKNARGWISETHSNANGLQILTLSHPSIAAWQAEKTDPTTLVRAALSRAR